MTKENIQNFTFRVTKANKTEMIVILYDIAIVYINDAIDALKREDKCQFRLEISRIRDTIRELIESVDTSMELGMNLLNLYIFCGNELTKAFIDYDETYLYHVESIFKKLSDAYREASKKDLSGPVMENAEKVYEGYTYNRSLTNETYSASGNDRGILA